MTTNSSPVYPALLDADRWKTYGIQAIGVSIAFFTVYPLCNWFSSTRTDVYKLYFNAELDIPLVPEFFWIYISMYILFLAPPFFLNPDQLKALGRRLVTATLLAGLVFLIMPSRLGFERVTPADPLYASLFNGMFSIDLPFNMVPSLHIVFSTLFILALTVNVIRPAAMMFWWGWLALIYASTLLVHQHHLLDIITGLILAWICHRLIPTKMNNIKKRSHS